VPRRPKLERGLLVTKNRLNSWKASFRDRAQRGKRVRAELPPIEKRRDWVVADLFAAPETPAAPANRQQRRAATSRRGQ
jgi:hypothetical protein